MEECQTLKVSNISITVAVTRLQSLFEAGSVGLTCCSGVTLVKTVNKVYMENMPEQPYQQTAGLHRFCTQQNVWGVGGGVKQGAG